MATDHRRLLDELERDVEVLRVRETERALRRMGAGRESGRAEVETLARRVCDRVLAPVRDSLQLAERRGDEEILRAAGSLLAPRGRGPGAEERGIDKPRMATVSRWAGP